MFSGIIESLQQVRSCKQRDAVIEIKIDRPDFFDDVKLGDSIACNGVCLTVEAFSEGLLTFAVGPETLHVTGWTLATLDQKWVNLERSMALGDRVHGHLVAGHVDAWAVNLAWAFVALRVVHSLVQSTANIVMLRFSIFMISWLVLIAMIVREALVIF